MTGERKPKKEVNDIKEVKMDEASEIMGAEIILTLPSKQNGKEQVLRGLLDSGTSASLMNYTKVGKECTKKTKSVVNWNTKGGNFDTFGQGTIPGLLFPQFTTRRSFEYTFHLYSKEIKQTSMM